MAQMCVMRHRREACSTRQALRPCASQWTPLGGLVCVRWGNVGVDTASVYLCRNVTTDASTVKQASV